MMNFLIMCQYYVAKALEPVRKQFPDFLVIHYMDDILFLAPTVLETQHMFDIAQLCLKNWVNHCPRKNSNLYTLPLLRIYC